MRGLSTSSLELSGREGAAGAGPGASADAVVVGAGLAGVSAALYLAQMGLRRVLLVDERPPLQYTSARSTEGYRNFWQVCGLGSGVFACGASASVLKS